MNWNSRRLNEALLMEVGKKGSQRGQGELNINNWVIKLGRQSSLIDLCVGH